jgi:RNA polymerase sigma-54 factor
MAFAQRLELKLGQSLVMTPQLQQAIKLLQLPNLELAAYVEGQLEENPLLQREVESWDAHDQAAEPGGEATAPVAQGLAAADEIISAPDLSAEKADALDAEPQQIYADDGEPGRPAGDGPGGLQDWSRTKGAGGFDEPRFDLENLLSGAETLRDHLLWQLETSPLRGAARAIGAYLVDSLDEAGYLADDVAGVAERLGAEPAEVEAVLACLQQFEPTGVFSRSLSECLSLQLREQGRLDPAMRRLMQNLDLLAHRDLPALAQRCEVDIEDLLDMIREVRQLTPKPGLAFARDHVATVVPDVFISAKANGDWGVELNMDTLPKVLLNKTYYAEVSATAKDKAVRSYIDNCYNDATWLLKSLDQRASTILKVVAEIVRRQEAFLRHGVHHLKPLTLRAVGDAIGMHESTISRVTANKYAATPRGVLELRYFFTSAISSSGGAALYSAESVRHRIKQLIDQEKPSEILSDDRIVEILRAQDIEIARRTIVKYRESMRIPSSIQRRRLKAWDDAAA